MRPNCIVFCRFLLGVFVAATFAGTLEAAGPAVPAVPVEPADHEILWTQWRGAQRDGTSPGQAWPDDLSGLELQWDVELGKGYSGPVVSADRVFVAETIDAQTEGARAFDRRTGEQVWQVTWRGSGKVPFFAARNGDWIRSTPAYDGKALYVGGMDEVLYKLSAATGEIVWQVDFPERFGTKIPDFGFASSPMIDGGALYVQAANSIVKVDRETGKTVWRALENDGAMQRSGAFSSPVVARIAGRFQLVVQTREVLYGLEPDNGEVLWSQAVPSFRGMNILTPLVKGERIFTSTHRNRSFLYEISQGPEGFESSELWNHKAQGYMSSPVLFEGTAYLHLGNGRLTAIDLDSGESTWTSTAFGSYWSMVLREDKILALDSDGELFLLHASGSEAELLDRNSVSEQPAWGHLAVSGDQVFVRELGGLKAYRLR